MTNEELKKIIQDYRNYDFTKLKKSELINFIYDFFDYIEDNLQEEDDNFFEAGRFTYIGQP